MKKVALCALLVFSCMIGLGQQNEKPKKKTVPFKDRLVYSGDISLQFGNFTFIGANPNVGYRWNDWFVTGVGVHYYYISTRFFNDNLYGGQVFARARVFEGAFLMTELQTTNTLESVRFLEPGAEAGRVWVPQWYLGAGYFYNIGESVNIGGSVLFDLIDDPNSPWQNPQIRGGVIIGL